MAAIILTETQGIDRLRLQTPLNVLDQGDRWLVYGTPYKDAELPLDECQFYVIFQKDSAKILGLGSEASIRFTESAKRDALKYVTEQQFHEAFGPRTIDRSDGSKLETNLSFNEFLYGGLVNTPQGAVDYAYNLLQSTSVFASTSRDTLSADEKSGIWYITIRSSKEEPPKHILCLNRLTGQVLAGAL